MNRCIVFLCNQFPNAGGKGHVDVMRAQATRPAFRAQAHPRTRVHRTFVASAAPKPCSTSAKPVAASESPNKAWAAFASTAAAACIAALAISTPPALAVPPGKADVSSQELLQIVKEDFIKRKYLVTGDLTEAVYSEQCHFSDTNNDFGSPGVSNWTAGVKALFVGERCKLALTGPVTLDEQARTITFEGWRQVDVFRVPGAPHTKVFTGRTVLKLDPVDNLVVSHDEYWDVPPNELLFSFKFFDPDFNPPGFD